MGSAQDVMSVKAWQAARAGNEWGLYYAIKDQTWPTAGVKCDTATFGAPIHETLDLTADSGFRVRVSCESQQYNEGEIAPGTAQTVRIYRITAVACNAAACPATDAAAPGYVERTRVVMATN
jgi:MSHA biogenesis protein MshP